MKSIYLVFFSLLALSLTTCINSSEHDVDNTKIEAKLPPNETFPILLEAVAKAKIFEDGKSWVDNQPQLTYEEIEDLYLVQRQKTDFDLQAFVTNYFEDPINSTSSFKTDTSKNILEHIESLWDVLKRPADTASLGTLLSLPHPYIVPGGRFREIYYWDSYFTMQGLKYHNQDDIIVDMVDNFAYLINQYGFIPNGNRSYYLSRSQPPFFCQMVELIAERRGKQVYSKYRQVMEKEYQYWTKNDSLATATQKAIGKSVPMGEGVLTRYYDALDIPRTEMFIDDVETAEASSLDKNQLFRDLRSAAESGWDFSSRWFNDPTDISTIHTTSIVPVDLNSLIYKMEEQLSIAFANEKKGEYYKQKATKRKELINKFLWDEKLAYYSDWDLTTGTCVQRPSLAMVYPLNYGIASSSQVNKIARLIETKFLQGGGVTSTLINNGEQWDAPNGWAPLQFLTVKGLKSNGKELLAKEIADRWLNLNNKVYTQTGKMLEKYNVYDLTLTAGGGEYPVQDGFGWTNGVFIWMYHEFGYNQIPGQK